MYVYVRTHTHTHTHTQNTDYRSAIKKNEMLPSVAIWMDFEGIMLGEINPRRNEYWILFTWKLKKIQQISERNKKEADSYIQIAKQ